MWSVHTQHAAISRHPLIERYFQELGVNPGTVTLDTAVEHLHELGDVTVTTHVLVDRTARWRCELSLRSVMIDLSAEGETPLLAALRCLMEALSYLEREQRKLHDELRRALGS